MSLTSRTSQVTPFILAGGESSRMGCNKALMPICGKVPLELVANALQTAFGARPAIVIKDTKKNQFSKWEVFFNFVTDVREGFGPLSGIHAALRSSESEFSAVVAVDFPLIETRTLLALASAVKEKKQDAAYLSVGGVMQPLVAIYRTGPCLESLERGMRGGTIFSPSFFLKSMDGISIVAESACDDPRTLINLNTKEDLEAVAAFLSGTG